MTHPCPICAIDTQRRPCCEKCQPAYDLTPASLKRFVEWALARAEDGERLETLERIVHEQDGGLLLHRQNYNVRWTGVGLGIGWRDLRTAIDDYNGKPRDAARAGGER